MQPTFQKHFDDRYTQSREHQILDYLNQRGAAVPQVVLSHAERGYLEMGHAGQNLAQWLVSSASQELPIFDVLAQSTRVAVEVSRLGICHLDMAPRNFMVRIADEGQTLQVCLIDFGNAISALFPLQKPLWMRPHADQHRLLRQALRSDWQSFHRRHGLSEPHDWEEPFDVPQACYKADWVSDLQVEAIAARSCVLAHGLGQMIRSTARMLEATPLHRPDLGLSLLHLEDEHQAELAIQSTLEQLNAWAQATRATPRPTRKTEANVPARNLETTRFEAPQPISPGMRPADAQAPLAAMVLGSTAPRPEASSKETDGHAITAPNPRADVALEGKAPSQTLDAHAALPRLGWRTRWFAMAIGAVMVLGWVILDLIYQAGATLSTAPLQLTVLGLGGVSLAAIGTLLGLGGLLWAERKLAWWRRLLYANVLGQLMLALELWVFQWPVSVIGLAMVCPALVLLGSLLKQFGFGHRTPAPPQL